MRERTTQTVYYSFVRCSYVYHFLEWPQSYNIKYYTRTSGARWFFADLLKTWLPMLLSFSRSRTVIDRRRRKKRRRRHMAERTHVHARARALSTKIGLWSPSSARHGEKRDEARKTNVRKGLRQDVRLIYPISQTVGGYNNCRTLSLLW